MHLNAAYFLLTKRPIHDKTTRGNGTKCFTELSNIEFIRFAYLSQESFMKFASILISSALLSAALVSCGPRSSQNSDVKIVGGNLVSGRSPIAAVTVALVYSAVGHEYFCTGTLIGVRTVLTAAHCVEGIEASDIGISFGLQANTAAFIGAASAVKHESFDNAMMDAQSPNGPSNDIAIVTLEADAPSGFRPTTPLTIADSLELGEDLVLAGYGLTTTQQNATEGTLRQVTTEITLLGDTRKELEFGNHAGRSACNGDSGGPAFVRRDGQLKLVGVTSRGNSECDKEGIYTDARYFSEWIKDHTLQGL